MLAGPAALQVPGLFNAHREAAGAWNEGAATLHQLKKLGRSDSPSCTQLLPAAAGERKICHLFCSPSAGMAPDLTGDAPNSGEITVLTSLYRCPHSLCSVQFMAWL